MILLLAGLMVLGGFARAQSTDTTPPIKPSSLSASFVRPAQIAVTWNATTDDVGVAGYRVYRNGALVADTAGTTFTETVPPGVYTYTVVAYDTAGNVSPQAGPTSPVSVTADTTPPSAPTWVSVVPATSSVALSWNAATDNIGVAGYYVYRNGSNLSSASALTGTAYTDRGLIAGNTFTYKVAAYDAAGNLS